MIGFVDESVQDGVAGIYVVGCVIVPNTECDELRQRFEAKVRFHFHSEGEQERVAMLKSIGSCGLATVGYVHRGLPNGQPRARALCFNRLLWDLKEWGVDEVVFESRQSHNDRADRIIIIAAQKAGIASTSLSYEWNTPLGDPLLWTADAIAGAVAAHVGRGRYSALLEELATGIRMVA